MHIENLPNHAILCFSVKKSFLNLNVFDWLYLSASVKPFVLKI